MSGRSLGASSRVTASRRLLFIRTDRLGETLLTLPAIAALKAAVPTGELTVAVQSDLQPLIARAPGVDHAIALGSSAGSWMARAWELARLARAKHFDVAIVSNPKKEWHLGLWWGGIPLRVGYDRKWGVLLTHRVPDRKALGDRHEVEYNLDLVRALGLPATAPAVRLLAFEREQADVLQRLAQQGITPAIPFVAVHPWTSNPLKQWPVDRFQAVVERVARLSVRVVIIGGPEEQDRAQALCAPGFPAVNFVGRLTLTQLAALLQRARLLVSNDSGPVHLAAAVGTPTLVLFGTPDAATGPRRWGPWGAGHTVIWKPSMDAITVDEVIAALEQQLTGTVRCAS